MPKTSSKLVLKNTNIGQVYSSNNYGDFTVVDIISASKIAIKFIKTNYHTTVSARHVRSGQVKDHMYPTVVGVGYTENEPTKCDGKHLKSYKVWSSMLARCYDTNHHAYAQYGQRGVEVHVPWHSYKQFKEDYYSMAKAIGLNPENHEYHLDKDTGSVNHKIYCKENCTLLSRQDNILASREEVVSAKSKYYRFIHPDGSIIEINNLSQYCRDNGLNQGHMTSVANRKVSQHKGYKRALSIPEAILGEGY